MKIRLDYRALSFATSFLALTACSGGGGGGTSSVSAPISAPAPVPIKPSPVTFQASGTSATYPASSATALVTNSGVGGAANAPSGQGPTITIIDDPSGVTKVIFNVPTAGSTFTQQYTSSVWDYGGVLGTSAPTAALLVTILRDVFGFPNTSGALVTQSIGAQSLNSAAYGLWASGDTSTTGRAGIFAFGNLTPSVSVPATGTATFNGATTGLGGATGGNAIYALEGKVQVIANFASLSATTNLTGLKTQNISTNAIGALPDLTGVSTISGNAYAGAIAGTGLNGTINGNFYGSAAQETAGVWQASGGGNVFIGSFGAK